MDDLSKLKHLVSHWYEHNDQHARTFEEWAERMRRAGREDLAEELSHLAQSTRSMDHVLGKMERLL